MLKLAPRDVFEQILEWAVIPTFDLVIANGDLGIVLVKRKIAPYQRQWALPGLRMYKNESIDAALTRIAKQEIGLHIDPTSKELLGQYVGRFATEHQRQDLSTGYLIRLPVAQEIVLNQDHFSALRYIKSVREIPAKTGAMYRFYLQKYFDRAAC